MRDEHAKASLTIRRLCEALLEQAGSRRLECIAKPAGLRPYEAVGFVRYAAITKLYGIVSATPPVSDVAVRLARPDELPALSMLDEYASGVGRDRRVLLAELAKLGPVYVQDGPAGVDGFAIHVQAGSVVHVGPVIAPDDNGAYALIRPALAVDVNLSIHTPRPIDAPLARMLLQAGLRASTDPDKQAVHMVRGAPPVEVPGALVYALMGSAMG